MLPADVSVISDTKRRGLEKVLYRTNVIPGRLDGENATQQEQIAAVHRKPINALLYEVLLVVFLNKIAHVKP